MKIFNTVQDLKEARLTAGQLTETKGYHSAGDGGQARYLIQTAKGVDALSEELSNGNWAVMQSGVLIENITVYIPTDYPSLQAAIDDIYGRIQVKQGVTIELMIEAGHIITSRLGLDSSDCSYFSISSQDSEVIVNRASLLLFSPVTDADGQGWSYPLIYGKRSKLPFLHCLFSMNDSGSDDVRVSGVVCLESSSCVIGRGCGVKNSPFQGLMARSGSVVFARGSIFTNNITNYSESSAGITAWGGSTVIANEADVSGSYYGVRSVMGSNLVFQDGVAENCKRHASRAEDGSNLDVNRANLSNCAARAIYLLRGCTATAEAAVLSGAGNAGIFALSSCTINAKNAVINNCGTAAITVSESCSVNADGAQCNNSNTAEAAIIADRGSIINFRDASATDSSGRGAYAYRSSTINAEASDFSRSSSRGVEADRSSTINFYQGTANDCGNYGLLANGGSRIGAENSTVTGASAYGARALGGSSINIRGANVRKGEEDSNTDYGIRGGSIITASGATGGTGDPINTLGLVGIIFR